MAVYSVRGHGSFRSGIPGPVVPCAYGRCRGITEGSGFGRATNRRRDHGTVGVEVNGNMGKKASFRGFLRKSETLNWGSRGKGSRGMGRNSREKVSKKTKPAGWVRRI